MPIVDFGPVYYPQPLDVRAVSSGVNVLLDASGEKIAQVFRAPKSGNIERTVWQMGPITAADVVRSSFQNVDLTTGFPDEIVDQSGDYALSLGEASSSIEIAHGAARIVVADELVAAVLECNPYVDGNFNVQAQASSIDDFFYVCHKVAGAWSKIAARGALVGLRYTDGTTAWSPMHPGVGGSTIDYSNASTPDERALYIDLHFRCQVSGMGFSGGRLGGTADMVLYDAAGTVLESQSMDPDTQLSTTNSEGRTVRFPPRVLEPGIYRVSLKPTSATAIRINQFTVLRSEYMQTLSGGERCFISTRTDGGAWTSTATTTRPMIYLIMDGIDTSNIVVPSLSASIAAGRMRPVPY